MRMNKIKNVIIYAADLPDVEHLRKHLQEFCFAPIAETEVERTGFVPHHITNELVSEFHGGLAFALRHEEKHLPKAAVRAEIARHIERVQAQHEDDELDSDAIEALKAQFTQEIIKRALVKTTIIHAYYHLDSKRLYVDTGNAKLGSLFLNYLIRAVESVKTHTVHVNGAKKGLTARLKTRIQDDHDALDAFGELEVGESCKLVRVVEGAKERINYSNVPLLEASELAENLEAGYEVESLNLSSMRISFNLTHELRIKNINWSEHEQQEIEDPIEAWNHDASVKLFLLDQVVDGLLEIMGYRPPVATEAGQGERDSLYDAVVAYVQESDRVSISAIQRKFRIGYNRTCWLVDDMEASGVVSEPDDKGQRHVMAVVEE